MYASSRRAWWESSAEAPLFAHHTRGSSSLPRTRLSWRTTRRHAASATAQFLSASRRPRTSSVVWGRRFLLRTALGLPRWGTVARSLSRSLEMSTVFGRQVPILACPCCDSRCIERLSVRKHGLLRKKSARLLPKSPPFFAQTRPLFMRTSSTPQKRR